MPSPSATSKLLPEITREILSYLKLSDVRAYSLASRSSYHEALPMIWRDIDTCHTEFEDPPPSISSFLQFVVDHPRRASYIRRLSIYWDYGAAQESFSDSESVDDDDDPEAHSPSELSEICHRAGSLFTSLQCLRIVIDPSQEDPPEEIPVSTLVTFLDTFKASPLQFLLIDSGFGLPSRIMSTCTGWARTLRYLMIDGCDYIVASAKSPDGSEAPQFPHLRVLATRDTDSIINVVQGSPSIESIHLLGSSMDAHSLPSLTAVISTMEALSDAAEHQAHAQASPNFQLQSATLSFSAEAFDLNQLLRALPFPSVKELTLYIDSENLRWKESGSMLAFAVEEFSKASSSIPVRFPDLVKLRFRFRDREGAVPAYLLAMADTRSSAASRLADTLQLPYSVLVSERGRLSDIEFWCKSSGHPGGELGILRASIARGKWEIMESFNPHLEEDWKLHSAQYELRQCFTIPMEPLSVIEERWRDI